MTPADDILAWSNTKLTPWRQDALRRLACSGQLSDQDEDELFAMVKAAAGFALAKPAPSPVPLEKGHMNSPAAGPQVQIKAVRNVKNVNRLLPSASLEFAPVGLTAIYGRNGSGKSGFVRIFRTACRTRIADQAKLKVLANVYGGTPGPQSAEIVVQTGGQETVIPWAANTSAVDLLAQVAVFDSGAAQLYVDAGNEIRVLPFGLALPHKLNEICLKLKARLEAERKSVLDQLNIPPVIFLNDKDTEAQDFAARLTASTTDAAIDAAADNTAHHKERLDEITALLTSPGTSAADLRALAAWVEAAGEVCNAVMSLLSDEKLKEYEALKQEATTAATAASADAKILFAKEPLAGVGSETWRRLWVAAKEYATSEAFPDKAYPPDQTCPLCQQSLEVTAADRLQRFEAFISGALVSAADQAQARVKEAFDKLPDLNPLYLDWAIHHEQLRQRDADLAATLLAFRTQADDRDDAASLMLEDGLPIPILQPMVSPKGRLKALAAALRKEADEAEGAGEAEKRTELERERAELEDRKALAAAKKQLLNRRSLLRLDGLYQRALSEVQTTGITGEASRLVEKHLTKIVTDRYQDERKALQIDHLKIGLVRKTAQTKATFGTTSGTALAKLPSQILSEGEQRALALAAFFTEVAVTEGSGPIVVDDPVSSLDRERSERVAQRLAQEAASRQVIIFTHDLIFFNDLCAAAEQLGNDPKTVGIFAEGEHAGHVDPAGVDWDAMDCKKRINIIRNDFVSVKKQHGVSPAEYRRGLKGCYGRLRETYEKMVEEHIFKGIVRRYSPVIETKKLRYVTLPHDVAERFHAGMTKASTHSHDNPPAKPVHVPDPAEFEGDLFALEKLIAELAEHQTKAEEARPSMS